MLRVALSFTFYYVNMDIQINSDQGRGKTGLATDLVRAFTGQRHANRFNSAAAFWVDPSLYYADKSPKAKITRAIVESRSDLVVLDDVLPQFLEYLKEAVQIARNSLRRNIVAIYCVQDAAVGVPDNSPFIPLGFVRAEPLVWVHDEVIDPTPEQVEKLKNAFKESAGQFFVVGSEDASVGITEESVGPYIKESRTKEILLRMAREIHNNGVARDKEELAAVYAHFGADSVDALAPTFYADAHDRITPILDRVRCYILVIRLAKKGHAKDVKKLFEPLGIARIYDAPTTAAHALLTDLQLLDHEYKRT